jgi:hypothetical protein
MVVKTQFWIGNEHKKCCCCEQTQTQMPLQQQIVLAEDQPTIWDSASHGSLYLFLFLHRYV